MYVIEVIPLTKAPNLESLSYYSAATYPIGTIISVPIRKKEVQAIVINSEPVSHAKTALRAASFSLKKLAEQPDVTTLPDSLTATAKALGGQIPAHLGSILFQLLPPDIRSGARPYPYVSHYTNQEEVTPAVLTATRQERYTVYRSLIRQAFAHRGSVLFVVPNSALIERAKQDLQTGIEKRIVCFSSTLTKKQLDAAYEAFVDFSTAKLIIATPSFAFLDRHDITHLIIDEAASPYYKHKTRPYLDARSALTSYAALTKRELLFGDIMPRTEEEIKRRDDVYSTYEEHPARLNYSNEFTVATPAKPVKTQAFDLFTDELKAATERVLAAKGRIFLLAARRGFSPLIICNDCGHILRCNDSGAPFSLYIEKKATGDEERWLYCSTSGVRMKAFDTCPHCTSWRLREQGIGIQKVISQTHEHFPKTPLLTFDHSTATTHKKAQQLAKQFYDQKGIVMVGTAMALPYLTHGANLCAVISLEAMRSNPSWRAEEQVLHALLSLREMATDHLLIQTRDSEDPLLTHTKRGSIDAFYDEEVSMRQIMSYPPFTTLIHLTWQGTKEQLKTTEEVIGKALRYIDMQCYNNPKPSKQLVRHALIKISHSDWPDEQLVARLRSLPPAIRIEINPDRII